MGIIATGINKEHLSVFDAMAEARFAALDIDAVMVYLISNVKASALPFLAEQFNVSGYKGAILASNETELRDLIKKAIELHRKKGTPYSIKEALRVLGYQNVVIYERLQGATYNGQYSYNGSISYNQPGWATFRVLLDAASSGIVSAADIAVISEVINVYKNARSHLIDVSFGYYLDDAVAYTDELDIAVIADFASYAGAVRYNGQMTYNGANSYSGGSDDLNVTII